MLNSQLDANLHLLPVLPFRPRDPKFVPEITKSLAGEIKFLHNRQAILTRIPALFWRRVADAPLLLTSLYSLFERAVKQKD